MLKLGIFGKPGNPLLSTQILEATFQDTQKDRNMMKTT